MCRATSSLTEQNDTLLTGLNTNGVEAIQNALVAGERSGTPKHFDFAAFKLGKVKQFSKPSHRHRDR